MTDESSNSTIELVRDWIADIINDREAWRDGRVAEVLAPEFVRHDRRKVIAQPPAGAAEYIASVVELERLTGEFPIYVMQEPIGVRRLEARPIATLSIEAQERHERREKIYRDD